ncbi:hybrid sensor histidine kinase/response regulator [Enterovirga sp. CN4-39]|uniref:hybrid sensor histidine kinase/response regulator n=1 Tax=Enterovirga sp. CN4-39 TaxID=3400910 RepID=UPI003C00504A
MDDLLREFLAEAGEHLDTVDVELVRLERDPGDEAILRNIFRLVHTIKGTCGFLGLPRLEALAHAAETLMGQVRSGKPLTSDLVTLILATIDRIKLIIAELERLGGEPVGSDSELIVALDRAARDGTGDGTAIPQDRQEPGLDQVLLRPLRSDEVPLDVLEQAFRDAPGPGAEPQAPPFPVPPASAERRVEPDIEAVPARQQSVRVGLDTLEHLMTTVSELVLTRNQLLEASRRLSHDAALKIPLQRLSQVTAELQDGIMKTRMQPIGSAWAKVPRLLRDLAAELGIGIELVTRGADTELDRHVLEVMRDPLIHMVRNCAAHGIEPPAERLAAGKPAHGTITLSAAQEGGAISIEIADDGRGLDIEAIRRRAVETALLAPADAARLSDAEVADLIFHPGFSTTSVANAVSGRGVGMDVVRTNVELIGGSIEILSEPGRGATFRIKLPLTLAIAAALIVETSSQRFAIPQVAIQELVKVGDGSAHVLERISGAQLLRLRGGLLPVMDLASLLGLPTPRHDAGGYVVVAESGNLTFGIRVDAVLETEEIVVKPMCRRLKHLHAFAGNTILGDGSVALILDPGGIARQAGAEFARPQEAATAPQPEIEETADLTTLLVFRGGDGAYKAVPLGLVARLEEIEASAIEQAGSRAQVQYRGRLMPLVCVDERTRFRTEGLQPVIVLSGQDLLLGLAVEEILDVVEEHLDLRQAPGRPDLVGTAIVRGRATEIIDVADFVPRAAACWSGQRDAGGATVLLVEHNAFFREMLIPVLKAAGHGVRTASSADEALRTLVGRPVDAVVTDLDVPDRSGLDFLAELRRQPETADMPVIAIASRPDGDLSRKAAEMGVIRTVSKFDRSSLLASLSGIERREFRELAA